MKNLKIKRIVFTSFFSILILFTSIFSTATSQFNYDTPIPLGAEVDLVTGLSEEETSKAMETYYNNTSKPAQIERIYYNFLTSIDEEKYFAGSYWEGEPYLLDNSGKQILDDKGRPSKNYDRTLYILVTNKEIIPKETLNPNIAFREVKYSYAQLEEFMMKVMDNLADKGVIVASTGYGLKENKIDIIASDKSVDIEKQISELIPSDSFICEYKNPEEYKIVKTANVAVTNGAKITASGSPTDYVASIGFPITWGDSSNSSKGWLTAGHFAYDNASVKWGAYTIGTLGNRNSNGNYDAATITKNVNSMDNLISSPYVDGTVINYQESTSAAVLPIVDCWIEYMGDATGYHYGSVSNNNYPINGIYGYVVVTSNKAVANGDSGGPVLRDNNDGTGTYTAVGIMTAQIKGTNNMVFSRLKYIRSAISNLSVGSFS